MSDPYDIEQFDDDPSQWDGEGDNVYDPELENLRAFYVRVGWGPGPVAL